MALYLLTAGDDEVLGLVESAEPVTEADVRAALRVQHKAQVQRQDTVGPPPPGAPYDSEAYQDWLARWREVRDATPIPEVANLVAEWVGGRVLEFAEVQG